MVANAQTYKRTNMNIAAKGTQQRTVRLYITSRDIEFLSITKLQENQLLNRRVVVKYVKPIVARNCPAICSIPSAVYPYRTIINVACMMNRI